MRRNRGVSIELEFSRSFSMKAFSEPRGVGKVYLLVDDTLDTLGVRSKIEEGEMTHGRERDFQSTLAKTSPSSGLKATSQFPNPLPKLNSNILSSSLIFLPPSRLFLLLPSFSLIHILPHPLLHLIPLVYAFLYSFQTYLSNLKPKSKIHSTSSPCCGCINIQVEKSFHWGFNDD